MWTEKENSRYEWEKWNERLTERVKRNINSAVDSLWKAMYDLFNDDQLKGSWKRIQEMESPKPKTKQEMKDFEDKFK